MRLSRAMPGLPLIAASMCWTSQGYRESVAWEAMHLPSKNPSQVASVLQRIETYARQDEALFQGRRSVASNRVAQQLSKGAKPGPQDKL